MNTTSNPNLPRLLGSLAIESETVEGVLNHRHGIVPYFMGGLGNQMFIAAAGYATSRTLGCPLYIPKSNTGANKHSNADYTKTIFFYLGFHLPFSYEECKRVYPEWKRDGFSAWNPRELKKGQCLLSYFQYYPSLAPFENELRYLFKNGLAEYLETVHIDSQTSAFLHIRRGDYLALSHFHYIQPLRYYAIATEELLKQNSSVKKIYVFSDDIEFVRGVNFFEDEIFEIVDEKDELKTMAMMIQCQAGAICANSTFSWWAAFLGAYEKRNPVFVPENWIGEPIVSLFPPEWNIIKVKKS